MFGGPFLRGRVTRGDDARVHPQRVACFRNFETGSAERSSTHQPSSRSCAGPPGKISSELNRLTRRGFVAWIFGLTDDQVAPRTAHDEFHVRHSFATAVADPISGAPRLPVDPDEVATVVGPRIVLPDSQNDGTIRFPDRTPGPPRIDERSAKHCEEVLLRHCCLPAETFVSRTEMPRICRTSYWTELRSSA